MAHFDLKTFNPEAFGKYLETLPKTRLNALIKSRALRPNSKIRDAFKGQTGVVYATLPMYGRLDGAPVNYDGETDIPATSTTTYSRGVVVLGRAKAWVEKDFSEDITGGAGFMSNVARQVAEYWEDIDQDLLILILRGIFSMTGAANLKFVENHTHDITAVGDGLVGPATLNTAAQKASGDRKSKFSLVAMHSAVATNLENLKLLEYLKYNDGDGIERNLPLATWNGRLVLVDDGMPYDEATGAYTTYILGDGAFDYEDVGAEVPQEMQRDPKTNGGQTTLYSRRRKVFAPYGISFTKKGGMVTNSPTDAELSNGANWKLVEDASESGSKTIDHKHIPIARILSLG